MIVVDIPGSGNTVTIPAVGAVVIGGRVYNTSSSFLYSVFFQGASLTLAQSTSFTFNPNTDELTVPTLVAATVRGSYVYFNNLLVADFTNQLLNDQSQQLSIDFDTRKLHDSTGAMSHDWNARALYDDTETVSVQYNERTLYDAGGSEILSWNSGLSFPNATVTTGANAGTLTNVPGAGGNPVGYLQVTINSNTRYIPFW